MSIIKDYVLSRYPNETWREKVEKMDEGQLIAVYHRLKATETVPEPVPPKPAAQLKLF
jgi:hypothetical protein